MNKQRQQCLECLELKNLNPPWDEIKRQYHKLALKWHPDKNSSPEATHRFQEVRQAFDFLSQHHPDHPTQFRPTTNTNTTFTTSSLGCVGPLVKHGLLNVYQHLPPLSKGVDLLFRSVIQHFFQEDEIILLHPTLEQMWTNQIFCLNLTHITEVPETFLVPLWHSEVYFFSEQKQKEIIVCCRPVLPEGVSLDEENHLWIDKDICDLSQLPRTFELDPKQSFQLFVQAGLATIQENDLFNVSQRADVIFFE